MQFKSVRSRIMFLAGIIMLAALAISIAYSTIMARTTAIRSSGEKTTATAQFIANSVKAELEVALDSARTLALALGAAADPDLGQGFTSDMVNGMLKKVLEGNPSFLGVYTLWEPQAFKGLAGVAAGSSGGDGADRLKPYWVRTPDGGIAVEPLVGYEDQTVGPTGVRAGDYYLLPKETKRECIINPYPYETQGRTVMLTSLVVPILQDGRFLGIAGVDIALDTIQKQIDELGLFEGKAQAIIISNNGRIVAAGNRPELAGESATVLHPDFLTGGELERLQKGTEISEVQDGELEVFVPSIIGFTQTPWSVNILVPTAIVLHEANSLLVWQLAIALGCLLIILAALWWVSGTISRPLRKATDVADAIALGDLSNRLDIGLKDEIGRLSHSLNGMIEGLAAKIGLAGQIASGDLTAQVNLASDKDELGRALHQMVENLNRVLHRTSLASAQVSEGSRQISDSSQALSSGATEQAASLEQITSSMTELGSQTKANAENATQANQLAASARKSAEVGNARMQEMTEAMNGIRLSSREISKIIKAIDDIAFQTNLLALNAAVEAARAGTHGKGFAVVAQEVRNLAGRSAKAAQETADLIEGSLKQVEHGAEIMGQTAESLTEIVEGAVKVTDLVAEIAAASNEQAQGIAQINQGLSQVEQVTQQSTANAEETASAAEELASQAETLNRLVRQFRLREQEAEASAPGHRALPERHGHRRIDVSGGGPIQPGHVIPLDEEEFNEF